MMVASPPIIRTSMALFMGETLTTLPFAKPKISKPMSEAIIETFLEYAIGNNIIGKSGTNPAKK